MQDELEALVAQFVGMEASLVCNMGYATNLMHIPAIMSGKGTLILSDQLNHTSLVFGCRLAAGAAVKVFRHCDLIHLEQLLKEMISQGQPKNHKPWRRIIVLIEGLYSMEGTLPYLPGLLALKRKYKFYLWIDEAHSIGAIGPRGRGICDWFHLTNTEKSQIDLLMGTFTKSFGAAGGYIAGSKDLISFLRQMGHSVYAPEITSPPILEMILESMKVMMNIHPTIHDGSLRLTKIHENAIYFRSALRSLGFIVTGEESSPVIPMLIFQPSKMAIFSRECLAHGIAVVIVAYPATAMNLARVRFCMSSNHDLKDLEKIVQVISDIGDKLNMKFHKHLKVSELIKS